MHVYRTLTIHSFPRLMIGLSNNFPVTCQAVTPHEALLRSNYDSQAARLRVSSATYSRSSVTVRRNVSFRDA